VKDTGHNYKIMCATEHLVLPLAAHGSLYFRLNKQIYTDIIMLG